MQQEFNYTNFTQQMLVLRDVLATEAHSNDLGALLFLSFLSVFGIVGNGILLDVFVHKKKKVVSTYLMATLAIIDIFISLVIIPLRILLLYVEVPVSICGVFLSVSYTSVAATVSIFIYIAFDRYQCVCLITRPLFKLRHLKYISIVAVITHIYVPVIAMCYLKGDVTVETKGRKLSLYMQNDHSCYTTSLLSHPQRIWDQRFLVHFSLATIFDVGIIIVFVLYFQMFRTLRKSDIIRPRASAFVFPIMGPRAATVNNEAPTPKRCKDINIFQVKIKEYSENKNRITIMKNESADAYIPVDNDVMSSESSGENSNTEKYLRLRELYLSAQNLRKDLCITKLTNTTEPRQSCSNDMFEAGSMVSCGVMEHYLNQTETKIDDYKNPGHHLVVVPAELDEKRLHQTGLHDSSQCEDFQNLSKGARAKGACASPIIQHYSHSKTASCIEKDDSIESRSVLAVPESNEYPNLDRTVVPGSKNKTSVGETGSRHNNLPSSQHDRVCSQEENQPNQIRSENNGCIYDDTNAKSIGNVKQNKRVTPRTVLQTSIATIVSLRLFVMTFTYLLCWVPFFLIELGFVQYNTYGLHIFFVSNVMNPIVHFVSSKYFRHEAMSRIKKPFGF